MSEEQSAEKSFEPTPKRLQTAREKGEIVKSQDVSVVASYIGFLLAFLLSNLWLEPGFLGLASVLSLQTIEGGSLAIATALRIGGSFVLFPALCVVAVLLAQRAVVFAPSKVAFKLNRISPLSQAKSKFGKQGIVEFLKSSAKVVAFLVAWVWLAPAWREALAVSALMPALNGFSWAFEIFLEGALVVLAIAVCLAAIDYLWQFLSFLQRNRMTRRDVMDENKDSEGDPHVKQHRRARALEIVQHQMVQEVPQANVVIVNPTHYAVALAWSASSRRAPVCVAKGVDAVAAQIRKLAQEHGVPIQSDPPTARALYAEVEVGQEISRHHYKAVAAAIRFAEAMRKKRLA